MGISEVYTEEVHDHLSPYYANWEPGEPLQLGDYGTLDGDKFDRLGNIRTFGISFDVRSDKVGDQKKFSSEGTRERSGGASAEGTVNSVVDAKAELAITFTRKNSVFFNAANCTTDSIEDIADVGRKLIDMYENDERWKKKWVVVTHIVTASNTIIAVGTKAQSSVTFEVAGDTKTIDLADASIDLKVASRDEGLYTVDSLNGRGITPLMKLHRITTGFLGLGEAELGPAMARRPGSAGGEIGLTEPTQSDRGRTKVLGFEELS